MEILEFLSILFVIAVILNTVVRYKHEISLIKDAKPNQYAHFVRYNREFFITVIVITEFDCIFFPPGEREKEREREILFCYIDKDTVILLQLVLFLQHFFSKREGLLI